jgi:thioredoxin reductase
LASFVVCVSIDRAVWVAARAELKPVLFEGFMANGIAAGGEGVVVCGQFLGSGSSYVVSSSHPFNPPSPPGQLTTTTDVENFPGACWGLPKCRQEVASVVTASQLWGLT